MAVAGARGGPPEVENQYARAGHARRATRPRNGCSTQVFEVCDRKWRGIGTIPQSGFRLRPELAALRRGAALRRRRHHCRGVAAVHRGRGPAGLEKPHECPAFGTAVHAASTRSARRWSRPRAPAPPTTPTARSRASRHGCIPMFEPVCPIPLGEYPAVHARARRRRAAHADADRADVPRPRSRNAALELPRARRRDARRRRRRGSPSRPIPIVVRPLFFPGGDIGSLAVHGTVNDLAMCGAQPLSLSAGFILEEGLPMEELWRIVQSMADGRGAAGRADRHRRHQGGRPRQGRRHLHQHRRHRA